MPSRPAILVLGALAATALFWLSRNNWADFSRSAPPGYTLKPAPDEIRRPSPPAREVFMREGKSIYAQTCQPCHGPDGMGDSRNYPPIANSPFVSRSSLQLSQIILRGVSGPITVHGKAWNIQPMPPQASLLSDRQLAAVMTFVRNSMGNATGDVVSIPQAAKARALATPHPAPLSAAEIEALDGPIPAETWSPQHPLDPR